MRAIRTNNGKPIAVWAVYRWLYDPPVVYLARKWLVWPGAVCRPSIFTHTDEMVRASTLEDLRGMLPCWLTRIPREEGDDTTIVESWADTTP